MGQSTLKLIIYLVTQLKWINIASLPKPNLRMVDMKHLIVYIILVKYKGIAKYKYINIESTWIFTLNPTLETLKVEKT